MIALPLTIRKCPDCGGPLTRSLVLRASGLGAGDVVQLCRAARNAPNLPAELCWPCGAPLPRVAAALAAEYEHALPLLSWTETRAAQNRRHDWLNGTVASVSNEITADAVIAAATERIERAERHAAETLAKVEFAKRNWGVWSPTYRGWVANHGAALDEIAAATNELHAISEGDAAARRVQP